MNIYQTLRKICWNKDFLCSRIFQFKYNLYTKKIRTRVNPYSGMFYAVKNTPLLLFWHFIVASAETSHHSTPVFLMLNLKTIKCIGILFLFQIKKK